MAMKGSLSRLLLFLVFSSSVPRHGSVLLKIYNHVESYYTWQKAKDYCTSYYHDLAVFHTPSDLDRLSFEEYSAWVGLLKEGNTWTWPGSKALNLGMGPNETTSTQDCAYYSYPQQWFFSASCDDFYYFFCEGQDDSNSWFRLKTVAMTHTDAMQNCKSRGARLAVILSKNTVSSRMYDLDIPAWTGLRRDGQTGEWNTDVSQLTNWKPDEPDDSGDCVVIFSRDNTMSTQDCSSRFSFICYRYNLLVVQEEKSWEEALKHCHSLGYTLFVLQPEDQSIVKDVMGSSGTDEVWVGLRFLAGHWFWLTGFKKLPDALPACPVEWQNCGTLTTVGGVSVKAQDCQERKKFLCTWG